MPSKPPPPPQPFGPPIAALACALGDNGHVCMQASSQRWCALPYGLLPESQDACKVGVSLEDKGRGRRPN